MVVTTEGDTRAEHRPGHRVRLTQGRRERIVGVHSAVYDPIADTTRVEVSPLRSGRFWRIWWWLGDDVGLYRLNWWWRNRRWRRKHPA